MLEGEDPHSLTHAELVARIVERYRQLRRRALREWRPEVLGVEGAARAVFGSS